MKAWMPWILSALSTSTAWAADVQFMTHELRPFVFRGPTRELQGQSYQLVLQLMSKLGYAKPRVEVYPFARGLRNLERCSHCLFFPVARTLDRQSRYKWVGPLAVNEVYFYVRRGSDSRFSEIDQFKALGQIAVGNGNASMLNLQQRGFKNLYPVATEAQAVRMLALGRVEAVAVGELVMGEILKQLGPEAVQVEKTRVKLYSSALYIAFPLSFSDAELMRWQQALARLTRLPQVN